MYSVLAIGGEEFCAGFSLAGVESRRADDAPHAADCLRQAVEEGHYGVVIIDEALTGEFDERTRRLLTGSRVPVVIAVPGEMRWRDVEAAPADQYIAELVRKAIGYQLDIQL